MQSKNTLLASTVTVSVLLYTLAANAQGTPGVMARLDADGVQRSQIIAGEYYFQPAHLIVRAHTPVELSLHKEASMVPHDFVIEAPETGIMISAELSSASQMVRFTPTRPGSYPFYCSKRLLFFKSHRDKGMAGIIEVVH